MTNRDLPSTEELLQAMRAGTPPATEEEARERRFLQAIMAAQPEDTPVNELAWARIKRSIEAEEAQEHNQSWWTQTKITPWQMAAAVVATLAIGPLFSANRLASDDSEPRYDVASSVSSQDMLRVTFVPNATEEEIRSLLLEAGAQIIGGPSALGLYDIAAEEAGGIDALFEILNTDDTIIESVQRN